jgi:peptide/nickel transport system permease protein
MNAAFGALLLRRLAGLAFALLAAAAAVFALLEILPGDPAALILGITARPDTLAALHHALGLDEPPPLRFLHWLGRFCRGEFGESYTYHVPIATLVNERLAVSLPLAALAILFSTALALPLGAFAAARCGGLADRLVLAFTQLGLAVPNFWLGLLLVLFFSLWLAWLPASGFPGWQAGVGALRALLLPAVALALPQAAILARITRASLLEVLGAEYIRTARAKGASERRILWRHALPNALLPILTLLGLQFSSLLAGTIIIENVFTLPGLGRLLFQAIAGRDLPVVQTLVVLLAMAVIGVNFGIDLLQLLVDPRLRRQGER